jgi:tetratricopeptide (TPR) repeat protein
MHDDDLEARQLARLQEALALGYGTEPGKAVEQLKALLLEVQDVEDRGNIILYEAYFLARAGRTTEARARLRDVAKLWERTGEHDARMAVVDALLDESEGRAASALKKMNRALQRYRNLWSNDDLRGLYEEIQFSRGRLLATIGDKRLALPILKECLTFERPKPDEYFYVNLGVCYFEDKQCTEAEDALSYALSKDLDTKWKSVAHYYLGLVYYNQGALAKAMNQFESALEASKEARTPPKFIYDALARTSKYLGLDAEAKRYAHLANHS